MFRSSTIIFAFVILALSGFSPNNAAADRGYYEIKVYTLHDSQQAARIDAFLSSAYLPALHRAGIEKVGVYKPVTSDTVNAGKKIVVFIPYKNIKQFLGLASVLEADSKFQESGKDYLTSVYNAAPYSRIESILLQAFEKSPQFENSAVTGPLKDRVYELRSYESATEKLYVNKVKMFNAGDEIGLFKRLGFNAIFYAEVLSGSHMPNLMYMTSFSSMASREEHWKSFVADPQWKTLVAMPEYQHNVSHNDILLLHPTEYSEI